MSYTFPWKSSWWSNSFKMLYYSRILKIFAENISSLAFTWLLLESGGGAVGASLMMFCSLVPQLLLGVMVSPLIAKGSLSRWMFGSDLVRATIVCSVALLYFIGMLPIWMFFVAAIVQSSCGAVYSPAAVSMLPRLVEKEYLQNANATIVSSEKIIYLFGLAFSATLITFLSSGGALFISGIMFVFSGLSVSAIKFSKRINDTDQSQVNKLSYLKRIQEGFQIVRKDNLIGPLAACAVFLNVGLTPWIVLRSVIVYEDLNGSAAMLTMIQTGGFIGGLVIGLILTKISISRQGALFVLAVIAEGISVVSTGFLPHITMLVFCGFIVGMAETAINVPLMVILQSNVSEEKQPIVHSTLVSLSSLLLPVAFLITGPIAEQIGNGLVVAGGGMLILLAGIFAVVFTPLTTIETSLSGEKMHSS